MQGRMPIIVSLLAGVLAIVLLNIYIGGVQQSLRPNLTPVMVASRPIAAGAVLDAKDVAMAMRPTEALPKLAIKWEERSLFFGQNVEVQIPEADYVLSSYFGGAVSTAQRLSERIDAKSNQRALTIPVTNETSLERSIRPGDRIDLILTYYKTETTTVPRPNAAAQVSNTQKIVTSPLLENVYVLFTGKYGQSARADYSTVTVLVGPDEAKTIIWAMNLGKLSILLRNPRDVSMPDRTFLSGDVNALTGLASQAMTVEEVISQRRTGMGQEPPAAP